VTCGACQIAAGELNRQVILQNRSITAPLAGSVDFGESLTNPTTVWAKVKTKAGKSIFDGVNQDVNVTHEITIRYEAAVTVETWVQLDGKELNIIQVEDIDERHLYLRLLCNYRGANAI